MTDVALSFHSSVHNRKEFNRLKREISQNKIDVVVSVWAAMVARDWGQFMEICEKAQVEVVCLDEVEDAGRIFSKDSEIY